MNKDNISIDDLIKLLNENKNKIDSMKTSTKNSREKLKKINEKLDKQEEELLKLIVFITDSERDVSTLDSSDVLHKPRELSKRINIILDNLRKTRNSLADIIRK